MVPPRETGVEIAAPTRGYRLTAHPGLYSAAASRPRNVNKEMWPIISLLVPYHKAPCAFLSTVRGRRYGFA